MTEPRGHSCPECGAPRGPDNTPSCDCTQRAADALREARMAQAAAAEDFDPLRIRPYIEVPEPSGPEPDPSGLRLFEEDPAVSGNGPGMAETTVAAAAAAEEGRPRHRARRTALLAVAGAGVAVVAGAGFASGLFGYQAPSRDRAAQEVRQSIPEVTASDTPASPSSAFSPPSTATWQPTPPPSPSATPSRSATPSPSALTPTVSSSASPSASETASGSPDLAPAPGPVLRRGDKGSEVTELQLRLRQLNLYSDEVNGVFTRSVENSVRNYQLARGIRGDDLGTYGPATRSSLESETSQP
ncbi:peptidoglycan-binding domain-containing protein [Streptomyces sp. NPDC002671]